MAEFDLSKLSFFDGFDDDMLQRISAMGEPVQAEAGAVLADQGDVGTEAWIVLDGEVEVVVSGAPVAAVGPLSLLGEMALLDLRPRSARLVARTDCNLVSFDAKRFRNIVNEMSDEARGKLAEQNERFRESNRSVNETGRRGRITG